MNEYTGYTTISVRPDTKWKIANLKDEEDSFTDYLERKIADDWEDSDFTEEDINVEEETE